MNARESRRAPLIPLVAEGLEGLLCWSLGRLPPLGLVLALACGVALVVLQGVAAMLPASWTSPR